MDKLIREHGINFSAKQVRALLAEVAEPAAPTTQGQHAFLTTYAGLSEADLTEEALKAANGKIQSSRIAADQDVQAESLSTQDVAHLLNIVPPNVRRLAGAGALYSVKLPPNGRHSFPLWQFAHERPLPGLRDVVSALPENYHPLEVGEFMTEPLEGLRGMSPAQWLAEGGDPEPVVALADERAWE